MICGLTHRRVTGSVILPPAYSHMCVITRCTHCAALAVSKKLNAITQVCTHTDTIIPGAEVTIFINIGHTRELKSPFDPPVPLSSTGVSRHKLILLDPLKPSRCTRVRLLLAEVAPQETHLIHIQKTCGIEV